MQELSTLARPYAKAVFFAARDDDDLAGWSRVLELVAAIVGDETLQPMLGHPRIDRQALAQVVIDVAGDGIGGPARNLIRVLAENGRLGLVPEIVNQYERLRAEAENRLEVSVIAAQPLSDSQRERLRETLVRRFGREIELSDEVDETLLGGAIVRAGDFVIDGSVRGRLRQLASELRTNR